MSNDDDDDERPILDSGEVAYSENGDIAFRVEDLIGEGRCCLVYSAHCIKDNTRIALKVFKRGRTYEGALQRELGILNMFQEKHHKIVTCFAYFRYKSLHCQAMELLEFNVRDVIYKNDRKGLEPWTVQKFARDLLCSICALHERNFVHADLKPANIMWSSSEACFKLLDFGLTYHTGEKELHQIQTKGYQAPEASAWNLFKEEKKKKRKRKLQGTFCDLTRVTANHTTCLNKLDREEHWPSESSGIFTASEISQCETSLNQSAATNSNIGEDTSSDFSHESTPNPNQTSSHNSRGRRNSVAIDQDSNNWRRSEKRRAEPNCGDDQYYQDIVKPGLPVDIWAFGCLLYEVLTGSKLFRAGDKLASVLKPLQLVEMKIGEAEIKYNERNESRYFVQIKDLIVRCLNEDPSERITASSALNHDFFKHDLTPSKKEITLFPTSSLVFLDAIKDKPEAECQDILKVIENKARSYGPVTSIVKVNGDHVCIEFQEELWLVFQSSEFND